MLQEIKDLITSVNSSYVQTYESKAMQNIVADEQNHVNSYILIEEFQGAKYSRTASAIKISNLKVFLYCYKFTQLHDTAEERQAIREKIVSDIANPLFGILINCPLFNGTFNLTFPPVSEFDANDVCVVIEFDYPIRIC